MSVLRVFVALAWVLTLSCATAAPTPAPIVAEPRDERLTRAMTLLGEQPPKVVAARRLLLAIVENADSALANAARGALTLLDAHAAEVAKRSLLREEVDDLQTRLQATARALSEAQGRGDEAKARADRLEEERLRLEKRIKDAQARLDERAKEVEGLNEKLNALKRIDLERKP